MKTYKEVLSGYIPEESVETVFHWIKTSNVQLKITRNRSTKLGDYRPPIKHKYHRISVNHDLNKYQFLITLIHEFAHLKTWELYQRKVKPHGVEWKNKFSEMLSPFMNENVFPSDVLKVLKKFQKNPGSTVADAELRKKLREYDDGESAFTLEDIPEQGTFKIHNGLVFKKIEKLRKRYKCKRLDNNRIYLVNALMEVVPVND
ncbi:MAG: SprT-like domain-containing protein [Bacteroidales bacterium]